MTEVTVGINCTTPLKISQGICKFSPNGQFLAAAFESCLEIRMLPGLDKMHKFPCLDVIKIIDWSPDSKFILCGSPRQNTIQVWSLEMLGWTCKIDEGTLGYNYVCWTPDGRHILTFTELNLRITIWSLSSKSVFYIKYVKPNCKSFEFSPDGTLLLVAERRNFQDYLSIFSCVTWSLVKQFESGTKDLRDVCFSPDSQTVCVTENIAEDSQIFLYSLDGRLLSSFKNCDKLGLGVKSISWSPTSQFLAVGSYEGKVQILNSITWRPLAEFGYPKCVNTSRMVVYKVWQKDTSEDWFKDNDAFTWGKYRRIDKRPVEIPTVSFSDLDIPDCLPKQGVSVLEFSKCGRYLVSINDNMPGAVWIWDLEKLAVSDVLLHSEKPKSMSWSPHGSKLAIATGSNVLYVWQPDCSLSLKLPFPDPFALNAFHWHPLKDTLMLIGQGQMTLLQFT